MTFVSSMGRTLHQTGYPLRGRVSPTSDYKDDEDTTRVIKRRPQGETIYINQCTSTPRAGTPSIVFAGTTRISTKLEMSGGGNLGGGGGFRSSSTSTTRITWARRLLTGGGAFHLMPVTRGGGRCYGQSIRSEWAAADMASLAAFSEITRDQAIAAFDACGQAAQYCDGQIVVVGSAILLFATIGDGSHETRLTAADCLEWRPARDDYHPDEEIPWLPAAAIPRYDRDRKTWVTRSHLLLRRPTDADRWLYCGGAHLGSYSYASPRVSELPRSAGPACYTLDAGRIPRQRWLEFGGYSGWRMTIAGETHDLNLHETARLARLLSALDAGKVGIDMTRWEGDSLQVLLNERFGAPMYLRAADDTGLYVHRGDEVDDIETFACPCCGIPLEYPRRATLPRAEALALVRGFFATGAALQIDDTVTLAGGEIARNARWVGQDGI